MRKVRGFVCGLLAIYGGSAAQAHDLGGTRARLVQYDNQHLTLTLLIRLSDVFQKQAGTPAQYRLKMMALASMKPEDFSRELNRLETHIATDTHIRINGRSEAPIHHWRWPDPMVAQTLVRNMVMNAVSGGTANIVHEEPFEIDAEVSSMAPISAAAMTFPREFGPVVLVGYRPMQVIVDKPGFTQTVRFPKG